MIRLRSRANFLVLFFSFFCLSSAVRADVTLSVNENGQSVTEYYRAGFFSEFRNGRPVLICTAAGSRLTLINHQDKTYCEVSWKSVVDAEQESYEQALARAARDPQAREEMNARRKKLDEMKIDVKKAGAPRDVLGYPAQDFLLSGLQGTKLEEITVSAELDRLLLKEMANVAELRDRLNRVREARAQKFGDPVAGARAEVLKKGYPVLIRPQGERLRVQGLSRRLESVVSAPISGPVFSVPEGYRKTGYAEFSGAEEVDG